MLQLYYKFRQNSNMILKTVTDSFITAKAVDLHHTEK